MTIVRNSCTYRFLLILWCALTNSGLARLYDRVERAIIHGFQGSVLWNFVSRPGKFTKAWENSLLCRVLYFLANLIPALLHMLYRRFRLVFEDSAAFRLCTAVAENVPAVLSWLFLLMMVCPHTYWNNMYSLGVAGICVALVYGGSMRHPHSRLEIRAIHPYLWCFFFMLCVGVLESSARRTSLRYLIFFVTAALLALLVVSTVRTVGQLKRMAAFGAAGLPAAMLFGIYQLVVQGLKNTASTVDMDLNGDMPGRIFSFFDNANTFAQVLVMLLGVTAGLLFASRTLRGKLAALIALGCGLVAILMTYSRASWVGLAAAVFLFVLMAQPRLLPVLILAAVAMLPFLPASIYNRILTIFDPSDSSTSSRFPIYQVGVKVWLTHPVTGVGLGSELSAAIAHNSGWYHQLFRFPHYHNIYLQLLVETGVLGMLTYVGGFIASCKESIRGVFAPGCDKQLRYLVIGCFSGLAGVMVCGLADYFWHYPRVMAIFWLIFGMMLCGMRLGKHTSGSSQEKAHEEQQY